MHENVTGKYNDLGEHVNSPCVASRKPRVLPHLLNAELLGPITSCRMKRGKKIVKGFSVVLIPWLDVTFLHMHNLPMSSAKPPRGSLQVPVTNCMSRSRTSLSTSFTSCRGDNIMYIGINKLTLLTTQLWQ